MLFTKVKKVRQSQPHWHPPDNKKFVQHICIQPMCWEPLLNKNTVQIRAKFARSSREVGKQSQDSGQLGRVRICKESREVRAKFAAFSGPGVMYKV